MWLQNRRVSANSRERNTCLKSCAKKKNLLGHHFWNATDAEKSLPLLCVEINHPPTSRNPFLQHRSVQLTSGQPLSRSFSITSHPCFATSFSYRPAWIYLAFQPSSRSRRPFWSNLSAKMPHRKGDPVLCMSANQKKVHEAYGSIPIWLNERGSLVCVYCNTGNEEGCHFRYVASGTIQDGCEWNVLFLTEDLFDCYNLRPPISPYHSLCFWLALVTWTLQILYLVHKGNSFVMPIGYRGGKKSVSNSISSSNFIPVLATVVPMSIQ